MGEMETMVRMVCKTTAHLGEENPSADAKVSDGAEVSTCETKEYKDEERVHHETDDERELAEYRRLLKSGRMMIFPCAIGDILYEPRKDRGIISEYKVTGFSYFTRPFLHWKLQCGIYSQLDGVFADNIGETVFLTMHDAEKVLNGEYDSRN